MGVSCIKGHGEAEATCAELNAQGVCIYFTTITIGKFMLLGTFSEAHFVEHLNYCLLV